MALLRISLIAVCLVSLSSGDTSLSDLLGGIDLGEQFNRFSSWFNADNAQTQQQTQTQTYNDYAETCFGKIQQVLQTNSPYNQSLTNSIQNANVNQAITDTLSQASQLCTPDQQSRMSAFFSKYSSTAQNAQSILQEIPINERSQLLDWIVSDNTSQLQQYLTRKGISFLLNPAMNTQLIDVALAIPTIQRELSNNPI